MCRNGDGCENWSKYDCPEKTKRQLATYPSAANESAADPIELARRGERARVHDDAHHHEEQRGQQSPGPAHPERPQIDAPSSGPFGDEERRDEEPAQHEERVDAEEPADRPRLTRVVEEHRRHREGTDAVERGLVAEVPTLGARASGQPLSPGASRLAAGGARRFGRRPVGRTRGVRERASQCRLPRSRVRAIVYRDRQGYARPFSTPGARPFSCNVGKGAHD